MHYNGVNYYLSHTTGRVVRYYHDDQIMTDEKTEQSARSALIGEFAAMTYAWGRADSGGENDQAKINEFANAYAVMKFEYNKETRSHTLPLRDAYNNFFDHGDVYRVGS